MVFSNVNRKNKEIASTPPDSRLSLVQLYMSDLYSRLAGVWAFRRDLHLDYRLPQVSSLETQASLISQLLYLLKPMLITILSLVQFLLF